MTVKPFVKCLSAVAMAVCFLMPIAAEARDDDRGRDRNRGRQEYRHDKHQHNRHSNRHNNRHDNRGRGNNHGWKHQRQPQIVYRQAPPRVIYRQAPARVHYYNSYQLPRHHRYFVGQRISYYEPVPFYARQRLRPPPRGHYYAAYGPDVLLVNQQNNVIVQVLEMLLNN